jgi:type II secretory pathway component PulF
MRYYFEAMDAEGKEIKDSITAKNEDEAQADLRSMGYFITTIKPEYDKDFLEPASKCDAECSKCANRVKWNMIVYKSIMWTLVIITSPITVPISLTDTFLCRLLSVKSMFK